MTGMVMVTVFLSSCGSKPERDNSVIPADAPIVMEISDSADSFDTYFTNIGSFMLNVDKTGESLGFEIENPKQSCISFEGTSNDNQHGAAGRFILTDDRLTYFADDAAIVDVYDLSGIVLLKQVKLAEAKTLLPAGVYIIGGEKVTFK